MDGPAIINKMGFRIVYAGFETCLVGTGTKGAGSKTVVGGNSVGREHVKGYYYGLYIQPIRNIGSTN